MTAGVWRKMEGSSSKSFRKICVFCGSSSGNKKIFSDAALDLGKELVERRIDLVYGGGSVGLMGLISKTVHNGGCHVLGVIPTALMSMEVPYLTSALQKLQRNLHLSFWRETLSNSLGLPNLWLAEHNFAVGEVELGTFWKMVVGVSIIHSISGQTVGEVKSVADMHERKAEMARQADAFIALPGGYGTLEELLEMITWSQLGIHDKPVGLLNVDGYYDSLLALFDKGVEEGFIKPSARHIVVSAPTGKELIRRMEEYVPMHDRVAPRQSWEIWNS